MRLSVVSAKLSIPGRTFAWTFFVRLGNRFSRISPVRPWVEMHLALTVYFDRGRQSEISNKRLCAPTRRVGNAPDSIGAKHGKGAISPSGPRNSALGSGRFSAIFRGVRPSRKSSHTPPFVTTLIHEDAILVNRHAVRRSDVVRDDA